MQYHFTTDDAVCSRCVDFELDDAGQLRNVNFTGGCPGNLAGIGRLVEGMDAKEAAGRLRGIRCGNKATSCPDQLANALEAVLRENR